MAQNTLFGKAISVFLMALFIWTFMIFLPHEEIKQLGLELGLRSAYAGDIYSGPDYPIPPQQPDLSPPAGALKFAWSRLAGRKDAIYLNIPSNQLSGRIILPSAPSPIILAKYDPESRVGTLALMRMNQVGSQIRAEIVTLSPQNFHHFMSPSFYNFAWLDFNSGGDCDLSQKTLSLANPPQIIGTTNGDIIREFTQYDQGQTSIPPLWIFTPSEQAALNASSYYWHQRLNNDPCFNHVSFSIFDAGDGDWHNISTAGFYNLVAFALQIHKAGVAITATPDFSQSQQTKTSKSFFTMTQTTTVSYYMQPNYVVATRASRGVYSDFVANPTWIPNNDVSFVTVQGNHSFPVQKTLIYQWSQTQSGFTGLFVFIAIVAIFALGGAGLGAIFPATDAIAGALVGGVVGGIAGLAASGFSPSLSTMADITPFLDSSFDFSHPNLTSDQQHVQQNTDSQWLNAPMDSTPAGFGTFVVNMDLRRALGCGGAAETVNCNNLVTQIGMDDPRFKQVYDEMFNNPTKDLQESTYPFTQR